MPMRRRAILALSCAVLLPAWPAAAEVGDRVRWEDVRLYDGSVLHAKRLKGQTVVVEFWATWCPFCSKQNPYLQRLHEKHGGKDLTVLSFSIDKSAEAVAAYMMERDFTFPVAMAGAQSAKWFPKRKGVPVVYVVDPTGRIVLHEVGELFGEDILGLARFAVR